jgi:hypothetical protein
LTDFLLHRKPPPNEPRGPPLQFYHLGNTHRNNFSRKATHSWARHHGVIIFIRPRSLLILARLTLISQFTSPVSHFPGTELKWRRLVCIIPVADHRSTPGVFMQISTATPAVSALKNGSACTRTYSRSFYCGIFGGISLRLLDQGDGFISLTAARK